MVDREWHCGGVVEGLEAEMKKLFISSGGQTRVLRIEESVGPKFLSSCQTSFGFFMS